MARAVYRRCRRPRPPSLYKTASGTAPSASADQSKNPETSGCFQLADSATLPLMLNPAAAAVRVAHPGGLRAVVLHDLTGRRVLAANAAVVVGPEITEITLPLAAVPVGTYLVQATLPDGRILTRRLVVSR